MSAWQLAMMIERAALNALLRCDFESFVAKSFQEVTPAQTFLRNWHHAALAWHLEQCRLGKCRRLIITLPPRQLKSIFASVALPAFALGHDPTARIICVSYSSELSAKLARDCRAVMGSRWYRDIFPGTRLSRERNAELDFMTTQRGFRLATSVGGTLTGRGGNLIILDDPMKPEEALSEARRKSVTDWVDNTLYTRLDDKRTDVIIIVMQRLHIEDLVGHVLSKGDEWTVLNLPAICEIDERIRIDDECYHLRKVGDLLHAEREPLHVLDAMKASMGAFNFAAQYQQTPIPVDGEIVRWEWFRFYETEPARGYHDRVVQSWDTASKSGELNDYSVCTTWLMQGEMFYLLDVFRKRLNYPELRRAMIDQAARWSPSAVLIEDKASGTALAQDIRMGELKGAGLPIRIEPDGDKITRAAAQSVAIEAGTVMLPARADWLADLRSEIVQFPNGRHDDQIDSITQFLKWARKPRKGMTRVPLGGI